MILNLVHKFTNNPLHARHKAVPSGDTGKGQGQLLPQGTVVSWCALRSGITQAWANRPLMFTTSKKNEKWVARSYLVIMLCVVVWHWNYRSTLSNFASESLRGQEINIYWACTTCRLLLRFMQDREFLPMRPLKLIKNEVIFPMSQGKWQNWDLNLHWFF